MTNKPKAREFDEFWLNGMGEYTDTAQTEDSSFYVHVIEYSAYQEAQAEIKRLKKYVRHDELCALIGDFHARCTCGLEQALTTTEEGHDSQN